MTLNVTVTLLLAGCAGQKTATTETAPTTTTTTPVPTGTPPDGGVITLQTRDGVALEADYYPAGAGAPGLLLVHMIPPSNDRTNWPVSFVQRASEAGYAVLVVDRRGAGGSDGVAEEAYTGPNGKFDVEAGVNKLTDDGFGPLAIFGASNGTTSTIDYTIWAGTESLPVPAALGLMTGGTYTENQNAMSALPALPAVFTYSTAERDWSEAQRPVDPGSWLFHEYANGDHGTRMFAAAPEVSDDLMAFLAASLPVN